MKSYLQYYMPFINNKTRHRTVEYPGNRPPRPDEYEFVKFLEEGYAKSLEKKS